MPCMCVGHAVLEFAGWSCVPSHRRTLRRCWHRCNADSQEASCSSGPPARFPTFYRARGRVPMALGSRWQTNNGPWGPRLQPTTAQMRKPGVHGRPPTAHHGGRWKTALRDPHVLRAWVPEAPEAGALPNVAFCHAKLHGPLFSRVDRGGLRAWIPWTVVFYTWTVVDREAGSRGPLFFTRGPWWTVNF